MTKLSFHGKKRGIGKPIVNSVPLPGIRSSSVGNSNIVHSKVCRAAAQPLKRLPSDGLTYGGLTGGQKVNNPSVIRRPTNPPGLQLLLVLLDVVSIDAVHLAVLGHKVRGMMFFYFFFSLRVFYTGKGFEQCFHLAGILGLPWLFFFIHDGVCFLVGSIYPSSWD